MQKFAQVYDWTKTWKCGYVIDDRQLDTVIIVVGNCRDNRDISAGILTLSSWRRMQLVPIHRTPLLENKEFRTVKLCKANQKRCLGNFTSQYWTNAWPMVIKLNLWHIFQNGQLTYLELVYQCKLFNSITKANYMTAEVSLHFKLLVSFIFQAEVAGRTLTREFFKWYIWIINDMIAIK